MKKFKISNYLIGNSNVPFIIAEAGVNHNGSIKLGKKMIDVAAKAGAHAIKFQSFLTDEIILKKAPKATYHKRTTGSDKELSWYDLLKSQEVTEGYYTVEAVYNISKKNNIEMPIMESVYNILYNQHNLKDELTKLLNRPLRDEII